MSYKVTYYQSNGHVEQDVQVLADLGTLAEAIRAGNDALRWSPHLSMFIVHDTGSHSFGLPTFCYLGRQNGRCLNYREEPNCSRPAGRSADRPADRPDDEATTTCTAATAQLEAELQAEAQAEAARQAALRKYRILVEDEHGDIDYDSEHATLEAAEAAIQANIDQFWEDTTLFFEIVEVVQRWRVRKEVCADREL